jgi:DNA-binding helix-hairpin-helix protein with protein kinase domain
VAYKPKPLESPRGPLPGRVSALVMRALAKKPADRPPSARAMIADIDAALVALEGRERLPVEVPCHSP